MRQFGEIPPTLSTAKPPAVSATTGLGAGGGASVQSKGLPSDGQGFGNVVVIAGGDASTGGSVTLVFPEQPPVLFIAGDDAFGTITAPNNDGAHTTIVVSWTGKLSAGVYAIHYEWSVSK